MPEGGIYEKTSDFDTKKKNKGFSFTANRENLIFSHYAKMFKILLIQQPMIKTQIKSKRKSIILCDLKLHIPRTVNQNFKSDFIPSEAEKERMKIDPGPGKY